MKKSAQEVLTRVDDTLVTAKFGLEDLLGRSLQRRMAGLRNLVVFGRAITNVLQNLRSVIPNFDAWYQPLQAEMAGDPLLKYFYNLRTQILKQGHVSTSVTTNVTSFNPSDDMHRFGPPPPHAAGFFMGDNIGGSGWVIQLLDETTEKFYVEVPRDIAVSSIELTGVPATHLGSPLATSEIGALGQLYYAYLERLVQNAHSSFDELSV